MILGSLDSARLSKTKNTPENNISAKTAITLVHFIFFIFLSPFMREKPALTGIKMGYHFLLNSIIIRTGPFGPGLVH